MSVEECIAAMLQPLGGRTAVAARLFGARATPSVRHDHDDQRDDNHDDEQGAPDADVQISINPDEVFPAASLAKLPIAVELMRRVDLGQFDLAERWDTSSEPRVGGSGVLDFLDPATRFTLGELCTLMLIVSDNTTANVLLDLVGMGEVNESMSRLGLIHTKLARRFMDLEARAARRENVTSAGDMLTLLALLRGSALPGAQRLREMLAAQQLFADLAEGWLPPGARLAHKDGMLPETANDTGLLTGPGGTCAYCVLTTGQRDLPAARQAIGRIVRLLWDTWLDGGSALT
jgi:beta-lactamase class A